MHMRDFTARVHNRDKLMGVAFDGIGSLPMATIDKFREMRANEFAAAGGGHVHGENCSYLYRVYIYITIYYPVCAGSTNNIC